MEGDAMSCRGRQDILQEYVEGRLSADARSELELHLRACASCRKDLRAYRALLVALPAMPDPQIPVDLSAQVMAAVRARRLAHRPARETAAATFVRRSLLAIMAGAFAVSLGIALWDFLGRIATFAGRTMSHDLVALWDAARDLWSLVKLLGEVAVVLRPIAQQLWSVTWRAGEPLQAYGLFILAGYIGVLLLGALLCWRALFPRGERRLTHASS
jgi:anti-sigma factor RsiW